MATHAQPLSVVIVSWNVAEHLDRCLASLRVALDADGIRAEVLVIDNASRDDSVARVREHHPWVTLRPQAENLGYVRANNLGIMHALHTSKAIWLLNPDTIIAPGTATALLAFLGSHPRAGLIGPKLLNADGTLQECAFRFPGIAQLLFALSRAPARLYHTPLNGRYSRSRFAGQRAFRIDHPLGAAMLVRSSTVRDVGPLDEGYFMYCEEIDWAWRMKRAGWERWLVPGSAVKHIGGASTRQARPETTAHLWESRARLYRKHYPAIAWLIASSLARSTFSRRRAEATDPRWIAAYERILAAWKGTAV